MRVMCQLNSRCILFLTSGESSQLLGCKQIRGQCCGLQTYRQLSGQSSGTYGLLHRFNRNLMTLNSSHFTISRGLSLSPGLLKTPDKINNSWDADSQTDSIVKFIDARNNEVEMKYAELLEKVKGRNLVKVNRTKKKGDKDTMPAYKIMSDDDLEVALRKQKSEVKYMGSKEILETSDGRIKQKTLELKEKILEHDLKFQLEKVRKWLTKGDFVKINIKRDKQAKVALESRILEYFRDDQELLGTNGAKMRIKYYGAK